MRFICIKKCRYTEDPEDKSENTETARNHGKQVEEVPLDVNRLVELSNLLALNNAFAQVHSQSRSPSTTNLSTVATVEAPVNIWNLWKKQHNGKNIVKITEGIPNNYRNGLILFASMYQLEKKMSSQTIDEVAHSPLYGCEEVVFSFNILCNSFQLFNFSKGGHS